jgi:hypothetical protein
MLRIECYPVLDGLCVSVAGVPLHQVLDPDGNGPTRVQRVVPLATIEAMGLDEALRDYLVDIIVLYPGLLRYALS